MAGFKLILLGGFELTDARGRSCPIRSKKAMALLAYLALSPGNQRRERIASLLWPDSDEAQARHSLRQALVCLRKTLGETALNGDAEHLQLAPDSLDADTTRLKQLLARRDPRSWREAAELCGGELLDGFQSRSHPFEDWLQLQREHYRREALGVLQLLLDDCLDNGRLNEAVHAGTRLLLLDPLREDVHRQLMQLYSQLGRYNHAMRQYQLCRSLLRRELGMEPDQNTENLHRLLQHRRDQLRRTPAVQPAAESAPAAPLAEAKTLAVLALQLCDEAIMLPEQEAALTQLCRDFGGTPLPSGPGDLRLVLFGLPQVRTDDCERALECGLELLDWAAREQLALAAGLSQGPLQLLQPLPEAPPQRISGPPLLESRRLVVLADGHGLLVSETIYRGLRPRLEARQNDTGGWQVTGYDREAAANAPFVGRRIELQQLELYLQGTKEAGCAHIVYIRGDAGIGKSRLLQQLARRATDNGFAHFATEVLPTAQHSDHYPLQQLIRQMLERLLQQPVEAGGLGHAVDAYQGRFGPLPGLAELAGIALGDNAPSVESLPQQAALETLLQQLAPAAPLLISVEDIHWADAATMTALTALVRAGSDCPLLLVLTSRFEGHPFSPQWRSSLGELPLLTLDLVPLRAEDSRQLVRDLGHDPDSDLALRCQQRAHGNPLFLEQLLCYGDDQGRAELPLQIASLVAARIDALDEPARNLIRLAAVLGQQFDQQDLLALGEADTALVDQLIRQRLLRLRDGQLEFAHALLQESLYAQLGHAQRQQAHLRAAHFYAGRSLVREAEHLVHAGAPEAATRTCEAAAQLLEHQHPQRALWFCEQALPLAGCVQSRILHQLQGEALTRQGRIEEAINAFDQAISLSDEPVRQVDSWLGIATAQTIQDQFDEALQSLDHAARLSRDLSCQQQARLHITRGSILFTLGQPRACLEASLKALEQAEGCEDHRWRVRALSGVGDSYYLLGQMQRACDHFRQAIEVALAHDLLGEAVNNYAMVATCQLYRLDIAGAQQSLATAEHLARRRPEPRSRMLLLSLQGLLQYYGRRDLDAAAGHFASSLRLAQQLGARRFVADGHAQLAYVALRGGNRPDFERQIAAAAASLEAGARHFIEPWLRAVEALGRPDAQSRRQWMDRAIGMLTPECLPHCHLHARQLQIDLALADHDLPALRAGCRALEAYAESRDLPWADFYADRALALGEGRLQPETLQRELQQTGLLHCLSWFAD